MIQFFATRAHHYLIRDFLDSWSPADCAQMRAVPYERFPLWQPLPNGVCVFIDLERLLPQEFTLAIGLAGALRAMPENYTVLNDPVRYTGRFNLQKILYENGVNQFRVYRVDELDDHLRFPVFVRSDLDHSGPITPLLPSRAALDAALKTLQNPRLRPRLMVVEYCDCADAAGVFRKYSVMNVAGTLVPRHVLFSNNWSTKTADSVSQETVAEEIEFMENFPHAAQIRDVFRIADLDYGRIDYGLKNGRVQVWEINTNPVIVPPQRRIDPRRMPSQTRSAQQILEALRQLARRHPEGSARPFPSSQFFGRKTVQFLKNLRRAKRK